MSRPRSFLRVQFATFVTGSGLLAAGAVAQPPGSLLSGTNGPVGLAVSPLPGETVGRERVLRLLIRSGTNEFAFMLPDTVQAQPQTGGAVRMISQDMSYSLTIRMVEPPRNPARLAEALEEQVAQSFPGESSREPFNTVVADRNGTGIQLQHRPTGSPPRLVRVLWVPFRAGLVEFGLDADATSASAAQAALDTVLLTFRSNEAGPLAIIPRSDKS
jgi:hypothetical protein